MRRAIVLALALALSALAPGAATARARWDTRLLAVVPYPGYPAHAYVHPNGRIYEGTYVNSGSTVPSRVLEYEGDGTLLRSWTMDGQDLAVEHGVQVATSDARGRLVLLDHTPPRAVLLDRTTGAQLTYASFPALGGTAAVPNYAAWGPGGELYVTDYANSVIWRVPPGGGTPTLWLQDARLASPEFGTTGIVLAADRRTLLLGQQQAPAAGGDPTAGALFRVPIAPDGRAGTMTQLWSSNVMDLPDGFAVGRDGRIYVAALGPNQIVVLGPDGHEQERWPPVPLLGDNGTTVPFDAISSVMFRGTSLITASQSNPRGDSTHWAIHDVEVGSAGLPELIPATAGVRPGEIVPGTRIALRVTPRRVRAGSRRTFRFTATAGGTAVDGADVRFAGRTATTDANGRARIVLRLRRAGLRSASVTRDDLRRGTARVRVLAARR